MESWQALNACLQLHDRLDGWQTTSDLSMYSTSEGPAQALTVHLYSMLMPTWVAVHLHCA